MGKAGMARVWSAAFLVMLAVGACQPKEPEVAKTITWQTSVDAALADAQKNDRPILLDMVTDWCVWCKVLDDSTYTDSAFIQMSQKFTMAKVDAEVDTATASKYHVGSYPTILLLRKDGTEIDRIVGYYRAPEFMKQVDDYLAGRNTLAAMEAEAATKGEDPTFVAGLAEKYYGHGQYAKAEASYLKLVELDPKNATGQADDALFSMARMQRKTKDWEKLRKYAGMILDRYPTSDMFRPAHLEIAGSWRRQGVLTTARKLYLDYAKQFPDDEDAPYAREQADTLAVKIAAASNGKGA